MRASGNAAMPSTDARTGRRAEHSLDTHQPESSISASERPVNTDRSSVLGAISSNRVTRSSQCLQHHRPLTGRAEACQRGKRCLSLRVRARVTAAVLELNSVKAGASEVLATDAHDVRSDDLTDSVATNLRGDDRCAGVAERISARALHHSEGRVALGVPWCERGAIRPAKPREIAVREAEGVQQLMEESGRLALKLSCRNVTHRHQSLKGMDGALSQSQYRKNK